MATVIATKERNMPNVPHQRDLAQTPFGRRSTASDVLDGVDLRGRRFIVTGGGSGLGAASVRALAAAGAAVTIATRAPERVDSSLLTETVDVRTLDLADPASVAAFQDGWDGPLDGLIANAGIMALPELERTWDGWERQLATNYLGHFALTLGLRDSLRTAHGRVVVVSSGAQLRSPVDFDDLHFAQRRYDPWVAYAQSKTADVLLAIGIARRWAEHGVTANAVAPGWILTGLQRHVDPEALRAMGVYEEGGRTIAPDFFSTPEQGAADQVMLAASPLVEGVTGRYFEDGQESPVVEGGPDVATGVARWSVDPAAADRLWELGYAAVSRHARPGDAAA